VALIVGFNLGMQEYSDRANQPTLPVVPDYDRDSLNAALMVFDEAGMIFERRDVFPAAESGGIY